MKTLHTITRRGVWLNILRATAATGYATRGELQSHIAHDAKGRYHKVERALIDGGYIEPYTTPTTPPQALRVTAACRVPGGVRVVEVLEATTV